MASTIKVDDQPTKNDVEEQTTNSIEIERICKWLRAAVSGAIEGSVSAALAMVGAGALRKDSKTIILIGIATSVAGGCGAAIGEFALANSEDDTEKEAMHANVIKREEAMHANQKKLFISSAKKATAAALAYGLGAVVPLLAAFGKDLHERLAVVIALVSFGLLGFGWAGAILGKLPIVKSIIRVLFGGWLALGVAGLVDLSKF